MNYGAIILLLATAIASSATDHKKPPFLSWYRMESEVRNNGINEKNCMTDLIRVSDVPVTTIVSVVKRKEKCVLNDILCYIVKETGLSNNSYCHPLHKGKWNETYPKVVIGDCYLGEKRNVKCQTVCKRLKQRCSCDCHFINLNVLKSRDIVDLDDVYDSADDIYNPSVNYDDQYDDEY